MTDGAGTDAYKRDKHLLLTLDPVHIGTGGYRLGRVDNTIVREPGTNLPKIPGTSIAGPTRANTAMRIDGKYPDCAGKGGEGGENHCGDDDCPVCMTYGYSKGSASSHQGLAQFSDARILFFPVHSFIGPIWVTSNSILREDVGAEFTSAENDKVIAAPGLLSDDIAQLNLGWLMLPVQSKDLNTDSIKTSPTLNNLDIAKIDSIFNRLVLVSDKVFSQIVNSNLEVRTSVAIDPKTGAAKDGALYTYEAIPRAAVLLMSVLINNPVGFNDKKFEKTGGGLADIPWIREQVKSGLDDLEIFGLGGMNTRGMGRVRNLSL